MTLAYPPRSLSRARIGAACLALLVLATALGAAPPAFEPSEIAERREKVLAAMRERAGEGFGFLVLRAPPPDRFAGDVDYLYRPENALHYLTALAHDRCALLLATEPIGEHGHAILFHEPASDDERLWVGERPSLREAAERAGLSTDAVLRLDRLPELVRRAARRSRQPIVWLETNGGFDPGEPLTEPYTFLLETLGSEAFGLEIRSPGELIDRLREVKSEREIVLLEDAVKVTEDALRAAFRTARPGAFEYELRAAIEGTYLRRGMTWGFPSIIGSGPNSCVLHYQEYGRRLEPGEVVLLDVGAENAFYSADVTRTIPVDGKFTTRQRQIYEIVLAANRAGIEAIRPGARLREVEAIARETVARGLVEIGMIPSENRVREYLPHGISHGIGLDVHDPIVSDELRPGMVITVEPGIYIRSESLGIRIEDDVLVTPDGHRVLSSGIPKDVDEIERLLSSREL
ncbi:MAG TPA: Xaa-Pro aminopeptidase [Planctomycetota bacterium]|nr:Xaa-Pro aminopeptidase [Planctomycetota bacterium]